MYGREGAQWGILTRDRGVTSYGGTTHLKMIMVAVLGKVTNIKKKN